jgi:phage terminase small subunit
MTDKQKRFCDEYLIDCNAKQAAIRAGYSPNSAKQIGQENLTKPDLREYIDEQLKKLHDAKIADADEVIKYLTSVMRGESTAEVVVIEGEGEGCSTARRMSKAPDEKERLKAAELLGKRFGLFTDKINVDGGTKVVIVDDLDE